VSVGRCADRPPDAASSSCPRSARDSAIGRAGAFGVHAGSGAPALVFFVAKRPETEDRSLEEIEREVVGAR
jgi:hypothetical protein